VAFCGLGVATLEAMMYVSLQFIHLTKNIRRNRDDNVTLSDVYLVNNETRIEDQTTHDDDDDDDDVFWTVMK